MITFKYTAAEDETVDPEIEVLLCGSPTRFAIQDATAYGGGWVVNEYGFDGNGELDSVKTLKVFKSRGPAMSFVKGIVAAA